MIKIFLDDVRDLCEQDLLDEDWVIVRHSKVFKELVSMCLQQTNLSEYYKGNSLVVGEEFELLIEEISWDHDLGVGSLNGYDLAKWLVEFCMNNNVKLPKYRVHSMNPVGKENIERLFENYLKHEGKTN